MTTPSLVLLGDDYLLWSGAAGATTLTALLGQGTATINRSQTDIDTSSKSSGGYATGAYGLKKITIDLDVLPTLPDTGYTGLETLCNASPAVPFQVEIRKGGAAGTEADAVFSALMYGTISSVAFTQNDKVQAKLAFTLAVAPTVDVLS
jgi:predicted secreted protein